MCQACLLSAGGTAGSITETKQRKSLTAQVWRWKQFSVQEQVWLGRVGEGGLYRTWASALSTWEVAGGLCAEAGGDPCLHGISLAAGIHIDCVGHMWE